MGIFDSFLDIINSMDPLLFILICGGIFFVLYMKYGDKFICSIGVLFGIGLTINGVGGIVGPLIIGLNIYLIYKIVKDKIDE